MLKHVYFPVLIDGLKYIHSNSIIVTQSKNSWGPDCCVDGDTYSNNGLHNEERTDQQLSNNTYITTHHRPACGSLLSLYLITQIFYVCKSKRLTSALANSIVSYDPIQVHDWLHHSSSPASSSMKMASSSSNNNNNNNTSSTIDNRPTADMNHNDMINNNNNNNNKGGGVIDMLSSFDRLRWQAPPPLRIGRGYTIDFAGGNRCLNCTRRVIFGNLLSGHDSHTLLTCLLLYSLYKCKFVNNSIIRKADFLTANDYITNADVKHIQLLGKDDDRKSSTLFDDDLDNANNSSDKTVLSKILQYLLYLY